MSTRVIRLVYCIVNHPPSPSLSLSPLLSFIHSFIHLIHWIIPYVYMFYLNALCFFSLIQIFKLLVLTISYVCTYIWKKKLEHLVGAILFMYSFFKKRFFLNLIKFRTGWQSVCWAYVMILETLATGQPTPAIFCDSSQESSTSIRNCSVLTITYEV